MSGYAGKLLRVNLSTGACEAQALEPETLRNYVGGRGLGAKLLFDELKPKVDALSAENKIAILSGPLSGLVPASGRFSASFKSPLTGTIFDSNCGGDVGAALKRAGFDGVLVEGAAEKPCYIAMKDGKAVVKDASKLWGKSTSEAEQALAKEGEALCIGVAGENLVRFACVMHKKKALGRGGLGAVFGSKKLKAIVVKGSGALQAANDYELRRYSREFAEMLRGHPLTGDSLARFGTNVLVNFVNKFGVLPVNNFQRGSFAAAERISGETISKHTHERKPCPLCPMQCKREIKHEGRIAKAPEYESLWALGPNAGNGDLKTIIDANELCDEYGMDTVSMGSAIALLMECSERGKLKEKINWGDRDAILDLIRKTAKREWIGNLAAEGAARAAKELGADALAMHSKGLDLPAYDPRGVKGQALSYATSNRGGCHLRGYIVPQEILGNPVYLDNLRYDGKAALVKKLQDISAMLDSLVLCKFTTFAVFNTLNYESAIYAKMLTAATGFYFDETEFCKTGERIYNLERLFNAREGFGSSDDALPLRFAKEQIPDGPSAGQTIDLQQMLQEYYALRGWDYDGKPSEKKLRELGVASAERYPKLQVALDLRERDEALRIAELSAKAGVDFIEAGTPLIKMYGLEIVTELHKRFPNKIVVADMKVMDTGYLEVEMAAKAGADIVCVLAVSDDSTITDAVGAARKYGVKIMADLIGVPKERMPERAKRLEALGVDYVAMHIGVDQQMRSDYEKIPFPTLKALAESVKIPIAVAGGLKSGTIEKAIACGAKICIAGGAITRAGDPYKATQSLLKEMNGSR